MRKAMRSWIGVAAVPLCLAGFAQAQDRPPAGRPQPGLMAPASKDPSAAPAGTYHVDLEHASAVARVLHRGISYSVLRFGVRDGTLVWNPARPSAITLAVIGFTGKMVIDTSQFTQQPMARMVGTFTVVLDAEFLKQ